MLQKIDEWTRTIDLPTFFQLLAVEEIGRFSLLDYIDIILTVMRSQSNKRESLGAICEAPWPLLELHQHHIFSSEGKSLH